MKTKNSSFSGTKLDASFSKNGRPAVKAAPPTTELSADGMNPTPSQVPTQAAATSPEAEAKNPAILTQELVRLSFDYVRLQGMIEQAVDERRIPGRLGTSLALGLKLLLDRIPSLLDAAVTHVLDEVRARLNDPVFINRVISKASAVENNREPQRVAE